MNISFQCDVCSKTLNANAVAAGRIITCPYCRNTTRIPCLEENERQDRPRPSVKERVVVESSASTDESQWRDPTIDPDWEKMLEKFPCFKPNPFGISFALDRAIQEAVSQDELDEEGQDSDQNGSTASQYSVDDLIKGLE